MRSKGIHYRVIGIIMSWLEERVANVVVGGQSSKHMNLMNMVFQGTVLGPLLWNLFFNDAKIPIGLARYIEIIFADDLTAYRMFKKIAQGGIILRTAKHCQTKLHTWGRANQITFDSTKESTTIISRTKSETYGEPFKMLGVVFDPGLYMDACISKLCCDAGWKIKSIRRTGRYFSKKEMIQLYKSKVLGYIECRTGAIYHATSSLLLRLDGLQRSFLQSLGLSEEEALFEFNLCPLETRRDIALLGVIHRSVLGLGPVHFKTFFKLLDSTSDKNSRNRHNKQIETHRKGKFLDIVAESILGLVDIYNLLPECMVQTKSVKDFQTLLAQLVKTATAKCTTDWKNLLSPRKALHSHPLKRLYNWNKIMKNNEEENVSANACNSVTGWFNFSALMEQQRKMRQCEDF